MVGTAGTKARRSPAPRTRRRTLPVAVESSSAWSKRKARRSVAPAARVLLVVVPGELGRAAEVALDVGGRRGAGLDHHAVAVAADGRDQQVRDG